MLKGSGDRIIPNMEGPGHVQVPWMEGYHHEPKQDSIKFKELACGPEGCLFLKDPVARATHVRPSTVSKKTTRGHWAICGSNPDQGYIQILITLAQSVNQRGPFI